MTDCYLEGTTGGSNVLLSSLMPFLDAFICLSFIFLFFFFSFYFYPILGSSPSLLLCMKPIILFYLVAVLKHIYYFSSCLLQLHKIIMVNDISVSILCINGVPSVFLRACESVTEPPRTNITDVIIITLFKENQRVIQITLIKQYNKQVCIEMLNGWI
jgi:hypothetical protein